MIITSFGKGDNANLPDFLVLASEESPGLQTHRSLSEMMELLDGPDAIINLNVTISKSDEGHTAYIFDLKGVALGTWLIGLIYVPVPIYIQTVAYCSSKSKSSVIQI